MHRLVYTRVVSVHAVFMPDTADDRFDYRSSSHFALDGVCDTAFLASSEEAEIVTFGGIVSSVSGIGEDTFDL